jgi:fatty acid CoA ligase FadD9
MSTDTREARFEQRLNDLYATEPQCAAAAPDPTVTAAADHPDLRLPEIIKTVFDGYADRPALGQRVVRFVVDPQTHRTTTELVPQFETITYRELWDRIQSVAVVWSGHAVEPGDRVGILGFTSVDYTTIDLVLAWLGAVSVPLQTSATATELQPILAETEPVLIASSVDYLDDAVELVLAGPAPKRLVVFDFRPEVDDQRDTLAAARDRLAGIGVTVVTLADEIDSGTGKSSVSADTAEDDPLALLIYTSGSTGAPKGAMYPAHKVADIWRADAAHCDESNGALPSIVLSFMPMSHVTGRSTLYGALSCGGTVYFAARPDLSTFLEDLALTRPTQLNLVPRVWDMIHQEVAGEIDRRADTNEARVLAEKRSSLLGGRFVSVMTGSASIAPELKAWVETFLDMHLVEGPDRPVPHRGPGRENRSGQRYSAGLAGGHRQVRDRLAAPGSAVG